MRSLRVALGVMLSALAASGCGGNPELPGGPARVSRFPDWPSYGHDFENSRSNPTETLISADNVATLELKWSYTDVAVTSTPVLYGDVVYFGDWHSNLHARDALVGTERWVMDLQPDQVPNQINHGPFVTRDTVYVGAEGAELFALNRANGAIRWQKTIDDQLFLMLWSSPVLVDGTIVIGVGSYQVFLPQDPPFRGNVTGVDAKTGDVLWKRYVTEGSGVSVWSSAAVDTNLGFAFIGTGQEYADGPNSPYSDALIAIRYATGELAWAQQFTAGDRYQSGKGTTGPDHDVGASPNLFEVAGRPLVGVGDKAGRYHALDRANGQPVWTRELTQGGANGGVMASTAYAAGMIYVVSNNGASGGAAGVGGGPGEATMFALDAADGAVRWQVTVTPGTFGGLALANGVLFVPTLAGELRAFDIRDGRQLFSATLGQSMGGGITVSGGMVFAGYGWDWLPAATQPGGLVAYGLP